MINVYIGEVEKSMKKCQKDEKIPKNRMIRTNPEKQDKTTDIYFLHQKDFREKMGVPVPS